MPEWKKAMAHELVPGCVIQITPVRRGPRIVMRFIDFAPATDSNTLNLITSYGVINVWWVRVIDYFLEESREDEEALVG